MFLQGGWIECSQEGTGLIEAEPQSWMTGPQKTLVDVFSALNVAWLVILLVFYYLQSIMKGISLVVKVRSPMMVVVRCPLLRICDHYFFPAVCQFVFLCRVAFGMVFLTTSIFFFCTLIRIFFPAVFFAFC